MKKTYNKLIRDKIPEIIIADGETPKTRILNKKEFQKELIKKILEEAQELQSAQNKDEILNEIVDLQELLDWLTKEHRVSQAKICRLQAAKNKKRGSFKKKLFLIETKTK